jgi:AmmeMemoRadiSam system protein A
MLSNSQKKVILQLAKDAIKEAVLKEKIIDKNYYLKNYPWLKNKGAVFVTINEFNNLRGCIGSIIAHQSLFDDIVKNAKAAALNDPRFKPVSKEELNNLEIEVSLLTAPKPLNYKDINDLKRKIRIGVDGVIINLNGYQATYLPSVWEQLPSFELFFSSLCQKAGLSSNCLEYHPQIYTYEAIKIKD